MEKEIMTEAKKFDDLELGVMCEKHTLSVIASNFIATDLSLNF